MSKSRQGHQQANHSGCPDRKLLSAMLRGELSPNVTDELAIHIDRCPACIQTLELIDDTSDSLAHDLRNASPTDLSIVHQELLEQESYGATTMFGLMGTAKGIQARLNPPCDFGQYFVEKHAGRGGMGDVYLGFQKTLKRPTAIKLLRPNRTNSETAAERFKEEMRVVAMLDHPNLVKAYDGGEFDGRLYLAMELLDGETLADYVKRKGPFSPQRACQICTKAARGLQHAHEAGIYHRDIKPGNIMFTREGKIKVLDLGLAFAPQDVISDGRNESISFAGTPDYMAPEQARDPKSVDARTDIYSLGCTLYFLLGGVPPFPKSRFPSVASLMNAHQVEPVPDIRLLNSDVSDELAEILNRMLCKDPIGRPQSAIEVCKLMESVNQSESTEFNISLDEVRPAQRSTPRSKSRWSWAFSIAMATAMFLLMLYGSTVVLHLSNQGRVKLTGDTKDISIEATARNGDRFNLQVGHDKTLTLRADEYEMRIVGRESLELAPSQIRVPRGGIVFIHVRTIDGEPIVAEDNPEFPPGHDTALENGQHFDTEPEVATASDPVAATKILSDPPRITGAQEVIPQQTKLSDVGDARIEVTPGFVVETWASGLGDIRGVAVGGNHDFGNDPFVYSVTQQAVLRVTAQNTVQSFAKGFEPNRSGRILFDQRGAESGFGGDMFVSAPADHGEVADLIYRVKPDGTISMFHSGPNMLAKGAAFGAAGEFGDFLFVINLGENALWRVDPSSAGSSQATGVTSGSWEDDMIFTAGGVFGQNAYLTDGIQGKLLRMDASGITTQFADVPGAMSIAHGEGAFGDFLYVGTFDGKVVRVNSAGEVTPFLTGFGAHSPEGGLRGIDVKDDLMWVTTDIGNLFRIAPFLPAITTNSIGMTFVSIPPGEFMMGSPQSESNHQRDETQHLVRLTKSFKIGAHEVTQEQYRAVMETPQSESALPNEPVRQVSWDEAQEFCRRLSARPEENRAGNQYRLPTEAEWQYACRAGTTTEHSFGDDSENFRDYIWIDSNSGDKELDRSVLSMMEREKHDLTILANHSRPHPVGTKKPNRWGLYDMHGNLWEWCQDWHADLPSVPETDPSGPSSGVFRVICGGSFDGPYEWCRSSSRLCREPSARTDSLGFRLVLFSNKDLPDTAVLNDSPTSPNEISSPQDVVTNSIGMKMTLIPAGEFTMGSPPTEATRDSNEGPQHRVRITKPFFLGTTEVTQGQWFTIMGTRPWQQHGVKDGDDLPVTFVSWADSVAFSKKLSAKEGRPYTLPTEAEWEYACRAGTATIFGFGDDSTQMDAFDWYDKNTAQAGQGYAHPVGSKRANGFGLFDMHGNVREWCQDFYNKGTAYSSRHGTTLDPTVGSGSGDRVLRGGSWSIPAQYARSANRTRKPTSFRAADLGFRLACSTLKGTSLLPAESR
jgi:formylglycine-generating enzyme required for sulfatase activity/serine/threonine protein kinase